MTHISVIVKGDNTVEWYQVHASVLKKKKTPEKKKQSSNQILQFWWTDVPCTSIIVVNTAGVKSAWPFFLSESHIVKLSNPSIHSCTEGSMCPISSSWRSWCMRCCTLSLPGPYLLLGKDLTFTGQVQLIRSACVWQLVDSRACR